jgi:hypothetical protein
VPGSLLQEGWYGIFRVVTLSSGIGRHRGVDRFYVESHEITLMFRASKSRSTSIKCVHLFAANKIYISSPGVAVTA